MEDSKEEDKEYTLPNVTYGKSINKLYYLKYFKK
jgi:hypothetical protein